MLDDFGYGFGLAAALGLSVEKPQFYGIDDDFFSLPEEVREEIEARKDELRSAEDLRRMAKQIMLRQ